MRPPRLASDSQFQCGGRSAFLWSSHKTLCTWPHHVPTSPQPSSWSPCPSPSADPFQAWPSTPQLPYGLSPCGASPTPLDSHGGGGETPLPPWPPQPSGTRGLRLSLLSRTSWYPMASATREELGAPLRGMCRGGAGRVGPRWRGQGATGRQGRPAAFPQCLCGVPSLQKHP